MIKKIISVLPLFFILSCLKPVQKIQKEKTDNRPNILFIFTDDQSHRTVSCYPEAYDFVKTPHIDSLAEKGVRFSSGYMSPWCMVSRCTMLTGHHQYGIDSMKMTDPYPSATYDPKKCPFWPATFRSHGYYTGMIGKWHTGTDTGFGRDWDYQAVWNRPRYIKNQFNYYYDQLIEFNGGGPKLIKGYSTDNYTNWAVDFINGKSREDTEKPWYLWLCYSAIHKQFTPAKRHKDSYKNAHMDLPSDIFGPRPDKPAYMQGSKFTKGPDLQAEVNHWLEIYQAGTLAIDEGVGRLVQALKETSQYDNTLIIYCSDQGFAIGHHGFRNKVAPYDETILSPTIFSMPKRIASGQVCEHPVSGVDIVPTIFSFAEIELPWKMHGQDLSPLLNNPKAQWNHPAFLVHTGDHFGDAATLINVKPERRNRVGYPWYFMYRKKNYKFIRYGIAEIEEFYDLDKDPGELKNLINKPELKSMIDEYRKECFTEMKRTDCPFDPKDLPTAKKLK